MLIYTVCCFVWISPLCGCIFITSGILNLLHNFAVSLIQSNILILAFFNVISASTSGSIGDGYAYGIIDPGGQQRPYFFPAGIEATSGSNIGGFVTGSVMSQGDLFPVFSTINSSSRLTLIYIESEISLRIWIEIKDSAPSVVWEFGVDTLSDRTKYIGQHRNQIFLPNHLQIEV